MKVVFRVDASLDIGTGHVIRCLTLALALREKGVTCHFICRAHPGNLLESIGERDFPVSVLATSNNEDEPAWNVEATLPSHAAWLGCDWATDAKQTAEILSEQKPDFLVVDHYALDRAWESTQRNHVGQIMVIDDLADRSHDCDLLLDQNLGRKEGDYSSLVPQHAQILVGPKYALLRPEFAALREYSLERRKNPKIRNILISMGGVDQHNATGRVLEALKTCRLPADCTISIVLGQSAPWIKSVQKQVETLPWSTKVLANIEDMAKLMADSDLAVGAGGSTTWERCCLGLPSIVIPIADNQLKNCAELANLGSAASLHLESPEDISFIETDVWHSITTGSDWLSATSASASRIVDGKGTIRVALLILEHF